MSRGKKMFQQKRTVLVVDDQLETRNMLRIGLKAEGFNVILADDASSGLKAAYSHHPDAVLLDIMMPDIDGYEMCRRLREMTDIPVLFLTAKSAIEDKVYGLSLGADDYIVKPFNFAELKYRLVRCINRTSNANAHKMEVMFLSDSVVLDCDRHELVIRDKTIDLTPKEFEVLRYLASHPGKVLTTDALLVNVWGTEYIGESDLVKQYIYRLRRKIEEVTNTTVCIHTIWGSGYCFEIDKDQ